MARVDPAYAGNERAMLVSFLDWYRETMTAKLDGLTDEQVRWTPAPTANSLLGIINHLTYVEHWWFFECLSGNDPTLPDIFDGDRDADFKPPPDQTVAFTIERYREECARSNQIVAAAGSLEQVAAHPDWSARGLILRWILIHMIEETARHAGHADITRELIDGATGE